jgi:hypothetical protein
MANGQGLADLLSGAAGAPVNRPGLQAFVANSQATNALRSAQTEDALLNAQKAQDEQTAAGQLEDAFIKSGVRPSDAHVMATAARMHAGSAVNAMDMFKAQNAAILGDPSKLGTPDQTAAQQAIEGKVATPYEIKGNYGSLPGAAPVVPQQTAEGVAETGLKTAQGNLAQAQADNPELFHPKSGQFGNTSPEGQAALTKAVHEGRLDPMRLNSRTSPIFAQMELAEPGVNNFNRLHADATLQNNAGFQQKAMSVDMLPGLLSHVVTLGKALDNGHGYSDLRTVGKLQQVLNGETNDPAYTEYMTARNDTLLRLAGVMRGVGMSDQAHTAEIEAMAPTLAPYALDAWLKGQMSVVTPLLERQRKFTNLGEPGSAHNPRAAPVAAPAPPAAAPAPPAAGPSPAGLPPGLQIVN